PGLLTECAEAGVRGAVILASDFISGGPGQADLERHVRELSRGGSMRILGPDSVGVACSRTGLNATFAAAPVPPGRVGFISQGGALLAALTGGGLPVGAGCSAFFSVGAMLDVGWVDCLEYLADDAQTERIGIYLESVG